jgi:hypothetical protein
LESTGRRRKGIGVKLKCLKRYYGKFRPSGNGTQPFAASRNGEIKRWDQYDPRAVDLGCDHALLDPPADEAECLFELGGVLFVSIKPAIMIRSISGRVS